MRGRLRDIRFKIMCTKIKIHEKCVITLNVKLMYFQCSVRLNSLTLRDLIYIFLV